MQEDHKETNRMERPIQVVPCIRINSNHRRSSFLIVRDRSKLTTNRISTKRCLTAEWHKTNRNNNKQRICLPVLIYNNLTTIVLNKFAQEERKSRQDQEIMHLQNLKESAAQKFYKDLMNKIPLLLEDLSQVQTPNTIVLLTKEVDRNCKMLFKKENNS